MCYVVSQFAVVSREIPNADRVFEEKTGAEGDSKVGWRNNRITDWSTRGYHK